MTLVRTRHVATAASLWRRFFALLVDSAFAFFPILCALAVSWVGGPRTALLVVGVLGSIAIAIANDIALVVRTGHSVGRRVFDIRVVDSSTMVPPSVGQVIFRNFIGGSVWGVVWHPIAAIPAFGIIVGPWPLICYGFAVADRRWHRGLNDRWAHTVVIDVRRERLSPTSSRP